MNELSPLHILAQQAGAHCESCGLATAQGPVFGQAAANPNAHPFDILAVTERPNDVDLKKGEPLAGRAGRDLDRIMSTFGWLRSEFATSAATLCTQRQYLKEAVWNKAIHSCEDRLLQDIQKAKRPRRRLLVLLCGKKALRAVSGFDQIIGKKGRRGYPIFGKGPFSVFTADKLDGDVVFFPVVHPSTVMREPALLPVWKTDIARALALMNDTLSLWKWPDIYTGLTHDVLVRLSHLAHSRVGLRIGTDVETAGKEPMVAPLICTGLAVPEWAICFPHGRDPLFDGLLAKILAREDHTFVGQNLNHDITSLEFQGGFKVRNKRHDILCAARVRYPQLDHDLMSIASFHRFIDKWKIDYRDNEDDDIWEEMPDETELDRMMIYCGKDSWATQDSVNPLEVLLDDIA